MQAQQPDVQIRGNRFELENFTKGGNHEKGV